MDDGWKGRSPSVGTSIHHHQPNTHTAAQELEGLYHRLLKRIGYHHPAPSFSSSASATAPGGGGATTPATQGGPAREDEEDGSGPGPYSPLTAGRASQQETAASVPAYNLVMTSRWLMAVPRKQREYLGVRGVGMMCIY